MCFGGWRTNRQNAGRMWIGLDYERRVNGLTAVWVVFIMRRYGRDTRTYDRHTPTATGTHI